MIQGFRPSRWLACAALAAAALAPAASAYAGPPAPAHPDRTPVHRTPVHRVAPSTDRAAHLAAARTEEADGGDDAREELAGSAAGVGRERPGRPAGEPADPELLIASRPLPVHPRTEPTPPAPPPPSPPVPPRPTAAPTARDAVTALGTEPNDRAADLAAHILPLGTGFALMGLGLGYLGVRLRRGA
ncbi:hypothetical protein ACFW2T_29630 [Streptomyces sp. NPDC058892]|uniref:hypothetical protein n=1 Tax=unclassified Streptomyces TaxID=2593676 RepID=UPI00044B86BC|nr:hypothetical protein [Streptomyces sp. PCS3-D2]WKV76502.1 hypothetical protein AW27_016340 [Streptomyces sp. PCS3-D2]